MSEDEKQEEKEFADLENSFIPFFPYEQRRYRIKWRSFDRMLRGFSNYAINNFFMSYRFQVIIHLKVDNLENDCKIQIDRDVRGYLVEEAKLGHDSEKSQEMFLKAEKKCVDATCENLEKLIKEALNFARKNNRETITIEDVKEAIALLHCKVWPFCR